MRGATEEPDQDGTAQPSLPTDAAARFLPCSARVNPGRPATVCWMTWIPIVVLLVIIGTDLWVYTDARKRTERGTPVALSIGALEVNTPTGWFVACLILWILFFPAYIVTRNQSS